MSSYYNYTHAHPTTAHAQAVASTHHSGRGRRAPRIAQNPHKQFRNVRKEEEAVAVVEFRQNFERARSFDDEDDYLFCPNLMSDDDRISIHSASSDRSSLSSGSPESSPQSVTAKVDASFSLNSNSSPYIPAAFQIHQAPLKLHQPAATRIRNAIPIVNPNTGLNMSSPPQSVSPSRMQQPLRRW